MTEPLPPTTQRRQSKWYDLWIYISRMQAKIINAESLEDAQRIQRSILECLRVKRQSNTSPEPIGWRATTRIQRKPPAVIVRTVRTTRK